MSQVKLTLRPPPNVDFIHGYPGIPPGAQDRPQAAVKGAIEVRVGPGGIKAKWVRIELRKVETIPGGGQANTYYDFVGPSPVNLWNASDEFGILQAQDFPFEIRIPESIPPTITLENRAGIKYELLASVCTKGKKSWLRARKSIVVSTMAPIIIDKHELHSTWPVYCQPDSRKISQEGVTLTVNRTSTCYGPGDRISVVAALKSDSLHTVILRGFEFTLKESTIFRAGPYATSKKTAPQVKTAIICENKFPVNLTLYGGNQHVSELVCDVPPKHTTTTLNAARHIDITYVLVVRALMGTGAHLTLNMPVIISNWQRNVSIEAIRRIGPAPSLSLTPAFPPPQLGGPTDLSQPVLSNIPQSYAGHPTQTFTRNPSATAYNTAPVLAHVNGRIGADEFGYNRTPTRNPSATVESVVSRPSPPTTATSPDARPSAYDATSTTGAGRRPQSARSATSANRFTVTNAVPSEMQDEPAGTSQQRRPSATANGGASRSQWPTAEEEKQRLYEKAIAKVEKVQGSVVIPTTPPAPRAALPAEASPKPARSGSTPWPTAEEEKLRLFNQAQAAAKKTQNYVSAYAGISEDSGSGSGGGSASTVSPRTNGSIDNYANSPSSPRAALSIKAPVPQYLTAEQEKMALKRYHEAKLAVNRTQNTAYSDADEGLLQSSSSTIPSSPTPYDSLFPSSTPLQTPATSAASADMPPSFDASASQPMYSEKERMRRAYEAQDHAALLRQTSARSSGSPDSYAAPPPVFSASNPPVGAQILSEKEMLRKKYAAEDAAAATGSSSPPQPPPRATLAGRSVTLPNPRAPPVPPATSSSSKVLTAAEEKAQLRAKYESEAQGNTPPKMNGNSSHSLSNIPAPPPLMPRPPVEYIQETQEEDARVSRFVMNGTLSMNDSPQNVKRTASGLDLKPFTPFKLGFDESMQKLPGPPPPLPPKPSD